MVNEEASKDQRRKAEQQLWTKKYECKNAIVLELLRNGFMKEGVLMTKLEPYVEVRQKVLWRLRFDEVIRRFWDAGSKDNLIYVNPNSEYLTRPKLKENERFDFEIYEAVAKLREENKAIISERQ
jgi:hypothetical protein